MAVKYFCDRCGLEMLTSITVQISAVANVVARTRAGWKTLEVCEDCGQELRAVLDQKIQRPQVEPRL